ncbi:MAG: four helix bundle protein [Fluviicola sp.]|nr:four helix bundle protein [Fluviicola sp.]
MTKPHQELEVWKRSFDFVKSSYRITAKFPDDEKFGLISQIRRAAVSVPVNIAEGAARKSKKEFVQFLHISLGSASELDTLLMLSNDLNFIDRITFEKMNSELHIIYKMLRGLINRNLSLIQRA